MSPAARRTETTPITRLHRQERRLSGLRQYLHHPGRVCCASPRYVCGYLDTAISREPASDPTPSTPGYSATSSMGEGVRPDQRSRCTDHIRIAYGRHYRDTKPRLPARCTLRRSKTSTSRDGRGCLPLGSRGRGIIAVRSPSPMSGASSVVDGERLELRRPERGGHGDVDGVPAAGHHHPANPWHVVPGVERVPLPAKVRLEPAAEVHRRR